MNRRTTQQRLLNGALAEDCLVPMTLLIGGPDTLAVDVIGARVLGYALEEVAHLRQCAEWGLGESDLAHHFLVLLPLLLYPNQLARHWESITLGEGQAMSVLFPTPQKLWGLNLTDLGLIGTIRNVLQALNAP
ncbi:MAG: hypothetical protein K8R89_09255 [Anaerolineae bacterium]|nr:hypothetical protein [Anaerolineae bacterium]